MDGWISSVRVVTSSEAGKHFTKATPSFIFPRMLQCHLISRVYTPIPSSLRFLNNPDPIHCAKSYLDQCGQPRGWISWSLPSEPSGWHPEGTTYKLPVFLADAAAFPSQGLSHSKYSLSDKVWRGADYSCQWKKSCSGGKWGLMENTENRNETNPLPLFC